MRKIIAISIGVLAIAILVSLNTAMAQKGNIVIEPEKNSQIASLNATPEEMEKMSAIVADMANKIESGNMTPEMQARTAQILNHVSHILSVMSSPADNMTYSIIKQEIKEVETKWNPWDEMEEH